MPDAEEMTQVFDTGTGSLEAARCRMQIGDPPSGDFSPRTGFIPPTAQARRPITTPQRVLILDVCNVLLAEPTTPMFSRLATHCGVSIDRVARTFRQCYRDDLWSGTLAEAGFWPQIAREVGGRASHDDIQRWREAVVDSLRPLPAAHRLPDWTRQAQVWLLSNLRHEWLDPVMERLGWHDLVERVFVSSRTGLVKPDHRAYTQLLTAAHPGDTLLYVDDKSANVSASAEIGIDAIRATAQGQWIRMIDRWLERR